MSLSLLAKMGQKTQPDSWDDGKYVVAPEELDELINAVSAIINATERNILASHLIHTKGLGTVRHLEERFTRVAQRTFSAKWV